MNRSMLELAEKTFLTEEGLCSDCQKWLKLEPGKSYLPDHKCKGKKCINSGYSPDACRYRVKTHKQALRLATMLAKDDGTCLSGVGMGRHSLACGDGDNCNSIRFELAKALAHFILQNKNTPKEKKTGH